MTPRDGPAVTAHLRRVRTFAGAGVGMTLGGAVVALAGRSDAGQGIALAGAGLVLWERAAAALARTAAHGRRAARAVSAGDGPARPDPGAQRRPAAGRPRDGDREPRT